MLWTSRILLYKLSEGALLFAQSTLAKCKVLQATGKAGANSIGAYAEASCEPLLFYQNLCEMLHASDS